MGSAFLTVSSLAVDASTTGDFPWQWVAIASFLVFVSVVMYRINQLTASPVMAEVRWDRMQDDWKPLSCSIDAQSHRAIFNATVTGRMWAVEPVVLDEMVVVFRRSMIPMLSERWGKWLPKRDVCVGKVGETWEEHYGPIAGRRMAVGDQIELDQGLFSFWGDGRDIGMRSGQGVYTQFRVVVRAPHRTLTKRIAGKSE